MHSRCRLTAESRERAPRWPASSVGSPRSSKSTINVKRDACVVRPFQPSQLAFAESRVGRRCNDCFGQQRQGFQDSTNLRQVVPVGLSRLACVTWDTGILDRICTVERAFILRVGKNAAEHALDVLKRGLARVILLSDGPQHLAGVDRPEFTHANISDTVADVIVPDFPITFLR